MAETERNALPAAVRDGFALLTLLCTTSLMNGSVFPQFDATFTFARDISVTFSAVALTLLGILAYQRPAVLAPRAFIGVALGLLAGGGVLMVAGAWMANAPLLTAGASLAAAGRAGNTVLVGVALSRLPQQLAVGTICVAFCIQTAVNPLSTWVAPEAGLALFCLLPLITLWLAAPGGCDVLRQTAHPHQATPSDLAVTRPMSFLAPASALFVCLFLFQVAFGFALRFGEVEGVPRMNILSGLPVLVTTVYVLCSQRRFPADLLSQLSALAVIAGFLFAAQPSVVLPTGDVALLNAGHELFQMTAQVALVAIASRNPFGAVTVVAWGNGACALGSLAGAAAGVIANRLAASSPVLAIGIPATLLLVFAAYIIIGLKRFSFAQVIDGVEPLETAPEQATVAAPEDVLRVRCDALATTYGLTPREAEVLAMLARGRDRAYIENALVVSRNTVKAHVKHVYAKLGIHSHQQLLDLVEK